MAGERSGLYPPLGAKKTGDTGSETGPIFCNKEAPNKPTDMPLVQLRCMHSMCVFVCVLPIHMYAQMGVKLTMSRHNEHLCIM